MLLFHLGAIAALFFFTWKAFFVADIFVVDRGEPRASACATTAC